MWRLLLALPLLAGCESPCGSTLDDGTSYDGMMCESRIRRTLAVSSDFSTEQLDALMLAGDDWAAATGGRVALTWRVVPHAEADVARWYSLEHNAQTYADEGTIQVSRHLSAEQTRKTMRHELGHTFGLGHAADESATMFTTASDVLSASDLATFDRLWLSRDTLR